jgi:predicted dehydrogenase
MNTKSSSARTPGKVNVAVVGLGFMGVTHLKAYLQTPSAQLVAVCDSVRLPVNGVLAGVQGNVTGSGDLDLGRDVRVCRELSEVLADPGVDLVDLCVPTPLHVEHSLAALHAGKHVLCEKPLALSSREARELVQAARSARGFFMPAMCMRFWPGWAWLKRVVQEKTYGTVQSAGFRRLSEAPAWSKATYASSAGNGGALLDLHIHDTDFVQFLFGRPRAVFSTGLARDGGFPDHVVTQYLYPGGPVVHAEGGWLLARGFHMSYTLHCERATLDYNLARGADALHVLEPGKDPQVFKADEPDGYGAEIRYLIDAILSGQAPKVVTAQDGLNAIEVCEAEAKSVHTGNIVELQEK